MRRALILLAAALGCIVLGGWWLSAAWHVGYADGVYCALGIASTDGCDAGPHSGTGRLAAMALIVTAIPLLGAVFTLATSAHIGKRLDRHHKAIHERLDRIEGKRREGKP